MRLFETITDIDSHLETIRRRRYGLIEVNNERLTAIHFRPFPKLVSVAEAHWAGSWGKKKYQHNQFLIYFNQPVAHSNFLVMQYAVSTLETTLTSGAVALSVLDHIAEIKQSDALLCELTSRRLSNRIMQRFGWERHMTHRKRRHMIKRFYGKYPETYFYQQIENRSQPKPQPIALGAPASAGMINGPAGAGMPKVQIPMTNTVE